MPKTRLSTCVRRNRKGFDTDTYRVVGAVFMKFGGKWKQMFTWESPAVIVNEAAADFYARTVRRYTKAYGCLPNLCAPIESWGGRKA